MTSVFFPAKFLISEVAAQNHLDISVAGDFWTVLAQQQITEKGCGSTDVITVPQKHAFPHTVWNMDLWVGHWKHLCFYCCFQSLQSQAGVFVFGQFLQVGSQSGGT